MKTNDFDKGTMVILPLRGEERYLLTVKEALDYIAESHLYYYLYDLVFRNVPIRDAIRSNGLRNVADKLLEYAVDDVRLKAEIGQIVEKHGDGNVADFDIQVLPVDAKLNIRGMQLDYSQMVKHIEVAKRVGGGLSDTEPDDTLHVAAVYDRYPCFDSYDYANENRCYVNLFVSDHLMTNGELLEIEKSPHLMDYNYVHDGMDSKWLPAVYYRGDGNFMVVATSKDNIKRG